MGGHASTRFSILYKQVRTRTLSTLLARVGQHSTWVEYQPWVTPVVTQPHSPVLREDDYARELGKPAADSGKVTHASLTCTHLHSLTLQVRSYAAIPQPAPSQSKYLEQAQYWTRASRTAYRGTMGNQARVSLHDPFQRVRSAETCFHRITPFLFPSHFCSFLHINRKRIE